MPGAERSSKPRSSKTLQLQPKCCLLLKRSGALRLLQMSPNHSVQREENALSEQEGAFSPTGKPPSPLPVAPSPPFQEDCYFTTDWLGRSSGPKCGVKFFCAREFRRHAHEAHGCSIHLLEYLKDCKCPECWDSVAGQCLRPEFDLM